MLPDFCLNGTILRQTNMSEKDPEKGKDALSRQLLETRTIVISDSVNSELADRVIKTALILEKLKADGEIKVFINSPGGDVYSGYAIYDILGFITCPITTVVMGLAASMGSILCQAGDAGKRFALPNSRIMIHQPLLQHAEGQITDLEIHSRQILKLRQETAELYASKTGRELKGILKDMDRDYWMTAKESLQYGLIDGIVAGRADLP